MKLRQFVRDGLKEAGRQLFGIPTKKRRVYKYVLTLSKPVPESRIIKELIHTGLYQYFLRIEELVSGRYGSWRTR